MANRFYYAVSIVYVLTLFACDKADPVDVPVAPAAGYYYPPSTGSTWENTDPVTLGWDTAKLNDLIRYVDSNNSTAFIILYKGKIVTEKYWRSFSATSSARIFSSTKSIGAFLAGLAQEQGKLDITKKVSDYLGRGWSGASLIQENSITVQHLLSMTSGLKDDLSLSYDAPAGTKWFYNTPAYHKIYNVLATAYGKTNTEYTNEQLWSKIGMQNSFWDVEPGGGPSMSCSGRDMARFGLMILSGGKWNGSNIMNSATYFQAMTNSTQTINPSYGYLWWLNGKLSFILPGTSVQSYNGPLMANAPSDLIAALGYGDKKIYVVKSKDLVVIRHGSPSNAPVTYALSNFDNEIWSRLMLAIK